jgi:hypothetical protein
MDKLRNVLSDKVAREERLLASHKQVEGGFDGLERLPVTRRRVWQLIVCIMRCDLLCFFHTETGSFHTRHERLCDGGSTTVRWGLRCVLHTIGG